VYHAEHGSDDGAWYHSSGGDADDKVGVVFPRHLERECARELAEKWPLHMQNSL
jgi:hypothetical protein